MRFPGWLRDVLGACLKHPISLVGSILATGAVGLIVTAVVLALLGFQQNPYLGLLVFLILPGVFVLGLVLIPIGIARDRRRVAGYPILDLNQPAHRGRFVAFCVLSFVNVVILASLSYKGVEYMDSPRFCGETCHTVMRPEYTAYQRSAHSRVECTSCHVGPGARGFVRAKLSGLRQVAAVSLGTYGRPIPAPVENLRPARETCEHCHWPSKFHGERLMIRRSFAEDEKNTPLTTVLLLKVGGGSRESGNASGIHWHMNLSNEVVYVATDRERTTIPYVRVRRMDGTITEYLAPGAARHSDESIARTGRVMDCVDCHNRPAHVFRLAEEEVDEALLAGRIDRSLPWIRKTGVELLKRAYASREEARRAIPAALAEHYRTSQPEIATRKASEIATAGEALAAAWSANNFPEMKVTWGTYPSNLGHMTAPGCFRCHDGEHASADGRTIGNDCGTCHTLLAIEEENPAVLSTLFPK